MITNLAVAQDPGRVTVEEVPVQDSMVIRADIMVKKSKQPGWLQPTAATVRLPEQPKAVE